MAIQNRYRCDNCGIAGFTEHCGVLPYDWSEVSHRTGYWWMGEYIESTKKYQLCEDCTKKFKKLPFTDN